MKKKKTRPSGIRNGDFGPGQRFDRPSEPSFTIEPYVMDEYNNIWEAYYSAIPVNEKFAAYVMQRVDEADNLQGVESTEEFM